MYTLFSYEDLFNMCTLVLAGAEAVGQEMKCGEWLGSARRLQKLGQTAAKNE